MTERPLFGPGSDGFDRARRLPPPTPPSAPPPPPFPAAGPPREPRPLFRPLADGPRQPEVEPEPVAVVEPEPEVEPEPVAVPEPEPEPETDLDLDLPEPTGEPRLDLPPPPEHRVPFDMDFIAATLAKVLGGGDAPPRRGTGEGSRRRRSFPPLPRPRPPFPRSPLPPAPPPLPPGVHDGPGIDLASPPEPVDERPKIVTELLGADGRLFRFAPPKPEPTDIDPRRGIRVALLTLLRQRRRMALSIVAVALGVGYLAGSLSLLQRVGAGLAEQAGADSERADLVIEGSIADDGPLQQVRKLVPDAIVDQARDVEGVAAVEARLESKSTLILGRNGKPVVGLGLTERPLGANYPEQRALNPYRFVGRGTAPQGPDQVVLDRRSADSAGVGVGDTVLIAGKVGVDTYTVTGLVEMAGGELPAGSSLALFDADVARINFELGSDDNAIAVALEPGADRDEVADRLRAIVPSGSEVSTGAEYAEHRQASFEKSFTLIRALLVGFAALALVVGGFTVANSMALLFDHRRRGFAMLRLMGASPSQLVAAATGESLLGGALAGVAGLVLGLGVGAAIEALIQGMGTPLPTAGPVVTWWIPLLSVVIGAAVTTSTALSPARHAARTPPVHAVTGADDRPADRPWGVTALRWLATIVAMAAASAVLAAAVGGTAVAPLAAAAGAAVGVILVVLPRLLSGVVSAATALALGRSVALRRMSTLRSRQARTRAASTTAALLLSAAVVTSLTVLSSSFVSSIDGQITSAVTADLVVDSATFANGGLSADLVPTLREQPGVAAVTGWRVGAAYVGSTLFRSAGIDGATLFQVLDLDTEGTPPKSMGIDDMVISRELADAQGISVGDVVPVQFQNAAVVPLRVRAIYRSDVRILFGDLIVDTSVMSTNLPQSIDVMAFVKLDRDAPKSTTAAIETTARRYGAQNVLPPERLVSERTDLLRGFARVIQWMLAFSIVLALIGVANTLQLGVNERRRELGLIRAVGATKEQVLRLVMAEAGALSVIGTLIGMAVGALAAWLTVQGLSSFGLDQFVAPVPTLVAIAAVSIGLGLVAAVLPAWRAARIPLLEAISEGGDEGGRRRRARARAATPVAEAGPVREPGPVVSEPVVAEPIVAEPAPEPELQHEPEPEPEPVVAVVDGEIDGDPWIVAADDAWQAAAAFETRGDSPDPATNVAAPEATAPDDASRSTHEVTMALRCYNCGYEPGTGETCIACGAPQTVTPVGLFTSRPEPVVVETATVAPQPAAPTFQTDAADIVDAAVVEDGVVVDPAQAPAASAPQPPVAPVAAAAVGVEDIARPHQPLFEGRPTPSQAHDPMRSPFGQHERTPAASNGAPAAGADAPANGRGANGSGAGIFSAGGATAARNEVPPPRPTAGPPPAFARGVEAGAGVGAPTSVPGASSSAPDAHGLAVAVARLSAYAQQLGRVPFSIAGALLVEHEVVRAAVAGTSLGMPTVVLVTDRRVLVVSDHGYVPEIESFALGPDLTVHGRHANELASITFSELDRLITVDQITDIGAAVELANAARNPTPGGEF